MAKTLVVSVTQINISTKQPKNAKMLQKTFQIAWFTLQAALASNVIKPNCHKMLILVFHLKIQRIVIILPKSWLALNVKMASKYMEINIWKMFKLTL